MWSNEQYSDQSSQPDVAAGTAAVALAPQAPPGAGARWVPAPSTHSGPHTAALAPLGEGAFDVPETLGERIELCRFLAEANLLPQALRKQPANVLLIMHKALALNIPLTMALEHLHVIEGKVGHSAELLRGLIRRHGHTLRWVSISDKEAVGELILRHDPKNPRREKFTIADAQRMKLVTKSNWQTDPESMLVARVTTRLVSRHCPEIALALGNLSAMDLPHDDPPGEPPTGAVEAGPSAEQQAVELHQEALAATTSEQLKGIGRRADEAGLLQVPVAPDVTLSMALLARINEIAEQRKQSTKDTAAARKTA